MNKIQSLSISFFYYCFPAVLLCQLAIVLGIVSYNYLMAFLNLGYIVLGLFSYNTVNYHKTIKNAVTLFIVYTLFSGVAYLYNDRPIVCYIDSLRNYILPMFMFYIGMNYRFDTYRFVNPFTYTMVFTLVITIYAYITFAPWYIDYRISNVEVQNINYQLNNLRFSGPYPTSYYIQFLCIGMLAYFLNKIVILKKRFYLDYIIVAILIISLILSQQRSAMLFTFISIPYFLYFTGKKVKYISYFFLLGIIVMLVAVQFSNLIRLDDIIALVTNRTEKMAFSDAFGERSDSVFRIFTVWSNYLLGDGVGVYGHAAFYEGFVTVNDCAWVKLLVEQGFIGTLLFIYILIQSLLRAIKNIKFFYPETFIILFYMVSMIGSDSLSMVIEMSVFFWFSLGRIWCKKVF